MPRATLGGPVLAALVGILVSAMPAGAQRLPMRRYTLADGLPHNAVNVLRQDRKAYLWIGTAEGRRALTPIAS